MRRGWGGLGGARAFGGALVLLLSGVVADPGSAATNKPVTTPPNPAPAPAAAPPAAAAASAQPAPPAAAAPPASAPVVGPVAGAPSTDDIARQNAIIVSTLIRSTLIALHQANLTGNYTVLRDLAAPSFRDKNSAADLANIFASLRDQKVDLSVAAVLEAQLTGAPSLDENRMLRLSGTLPTKPNPISFQLAYQALDGSSRLSGIAVGPSGPVALSLPPAAAKAADTGPSASSVIPQVETALADPKAKVTTTKTKAKTVTRQPATVAAPMALVPPPPKERPATKATAKN